MTTNNFIIEIQGLYGQYNSFQRKHVEAWLSKLRAELLPVLLRQVIESVLWTHNKRPPGLAEFNAALKEIRKNGTEEYQPFQPLQIEEDEKATPEQIEQGFEMLKSVVKSKSVNKSELSPEEQKAILMQMESERGKA